MRLARWLFLIALIGGCEVVADFNRVKLDEKRTIGPTPLPTVDGGMALMPDATAPDGALIAPDLGDAGPDASHPHHDGGADASRVVDAAGIDAALGTQVGPDLVDATIEVTNGI